MDSDKLQKKFYDTFNLFWKEVILIERDSFINNPSMDTIIYEIGSKKFTVLNNKHEVYDKLKKQISQKIIVQLQRYILEYGI